MAYDANTDYSALQAELKKKIAASTSTTEKAALQSQYDAAEQSRLEKAASNLSKYGAYLNDSELDSAAGIQAENNLGTTYERQKEQLNDYYAQAKQNANNDALSRGMARSTFVSDRMAGLDSDLATGLSNIDEDKAAAIQSAKSSILDNYQTNAANALTQEKSDYADNIMAYYNDYQAEINKVKGDNDTTNDWQIPILQSARNQKILAQQEAAAKSTSGSGSGSGGSSGSSASGDVYDTLYSAGITTTERAYAWLLGQGYSSTEAQNLADNYSYMYNSGEFKQNSGGGGGNGGTGGGGSTDSLYVSGYGNISYSEAQRLEDLGVIVMTGVDSNGDPIYQKVSTKTQTRNVATTK